MPQISVIVPIYNVEPYLCRCVDSILAQTFRDFEIILIDDGSPDRCPKICDHYAGRDNRIHVIHQKNGGLSAARNAGIDWAFANSDSEWITFIDSDDWVYPQYLEFLYRAAVEEDVLISVCGTAYERNDVHEMLPQKYQVRTISSEQYWTDNNGEISVAWEKLYKKHLFKQVRFPIGMLYEDEFTTYKLLFATERLAVLHNNLYIYYYSERSIIRSNWNEKKFSNVDAVLEQIEFFKAKGYSQIERGLRGRLASIIKHDFAVIKKEPERFSEFRAVIEKKIEKSYKKQYPKYASLPFMQGWFLCRWIVWSETYKVYTRVASRKVAKAFKLFVD